MPILACSRCGTLRSTPYFTPDTAKFYYETVYGPVKRRGQAPSEHFAHQRNNTLVPFLEPYLHEFETVLDFGGGSGGRTADLLSRGKAVSLLEVEGEYSEQAFRSGLSRHEDGAKYDLVIVSHVIEHLLDPRAEMQTVIDTYCKEGGYLLVATPIIDYVKARKWLRLFHYAHKYYFTRDALTGLIVGLSGNLIYHDNVDNFLFRLGAGDGPQSADALYERGAAATRQAIKEAERELFWRRLLRRK